VAKILNSKKRLQCEWFDLVLQDFSPKNKDQLTIIVSSKISKKAVVRNRIKRLLKVVIGGQTKLPKDKKITVIAKTDFSEAKAGEVEKLFNRLLGH